MSSEYFSFNELLAMGALSVGNNCEISRKISFHRFCGRIGDNVRIDDWCSIKGAVNFGSRIHLSSFCMISGTHFPVYIEDFVTLSTHVSVFTGSDDYNADAVPGPFAEPHEAIRKDSVHIRCAAIVGTHCAVLPGTVIGRGASIGAHCLVYGDVPDGAMVRSPKAVRLERRRNHEKILDFAMRILDKTC